MVPWYLAPEHSFNVTPSNIGGMKVDKDRKRTSSVFDGLTPSALRLVHLDKVTRPPASDQR